jgi:hypothetical protein
VIALVAAFICGLILLAFGARMSLDLGLAWRCPVIAISGVPCPSCGSTRAFGALAELDLLGALRFNPLIVLGTLALPVFFASARSFPPFLLRHAWIIFGAAVMLNWVYLWMFLPR